MVDPDAGGAAIFGSGPPVDPTSWSWEGWIRGEPTASLDISLAAWFDSNQGFSINQSRFQFDNDAVPATVLDDTWHHVAVTADGPSEGPVTTNVYVDGEFIGSASENVQTDPGVPTTDGAMALSTDSGSVHLDEVALYGYALSSTQIDLHFDRTGLGAATSTVITPGQQIRPGSTDRLAVAVNPVEPGTGVAAGEVSISESGSSDEIGRAVLDAGVASVELDYLPSGVVDLVAIYEPAGNQFAPSQSAAVPVTINRAVSALDIEVADPAPSDEPVILGVGVDTVAPNPTGMVTVTVDGTALPDIEMTAGDNAVVQVDLGVLNPGTHDIEVDYEGDDNVEGADGTGQVNVIAPVTITLLEPPVFTVWQQGEWSVEVGSGDGNVTDVPDGQVVAHGPNVVSGAVELDDGVALLPVTFTSAGSSDVSFEYLPPVGSLFAGAETDPQSVTVAKGTATVEVESDGSPSGEGLDVTFTATVTDSGGDGAPSGEVRFTSSIDSVSVDRPIIGGVATWTTSELSAGDHEITGEFLGDDDYEQGATGSVSQVIDELAGVTLSVDPVSAPVGEAVTFTVQVDASDGSGVPVGSVTLWEAMLPISLPAAVNGAGEATISHVFSAAGDHQITARYSADGYQGQTAAPTTVEVTRRDSPVTVQVEPTVFGEQPVVHVSSGDLFGLDAPSSVTATVDGEAPVSFALDDNGAGSFTLPADGLNVGVNQITVEHDADDRWNSYTETIDLAVAKAATRISGSTEDLVVIPTSSATIDFEAEPVGPGDGSPTGTVQAHIAGDPVGNAVQVNAGEVVLSAAALGGLGVHDVDLVYSGDDNFEGDTTGESERVRVVVAKDVTITPTVVTPSPSDLGAEVTVNVDVSDPASGGTPGGTVALFDGDRTVAVADLANGTAALRTRLLHAGTRNLSVHYSGDTVFAPTVSAGFSQDVNMGSTDDMVLDTVPGVVVEDRPLVLRAQLDGTGYGPDGGVRPGGEVKFFDATGTELGVGAVDSNGVAVWRIPAGLSEGPHSFTATYAGDANYHNDPVDTGDVTVDVLAELAFSASLSDDVILAGDTVTGSIANPNPDIDEVTWYWGDGTSDVSSDPAAPLVHDYVTPGLYTIIVHAADTDPATARSNWERFDLRVIGDETPQADPGGPRIVEVGETVRFDASISRPSFGFDHTSFEWDLGDGTTSTDTVIEHTYETAGTYDVELTAAPVLAAVGGPSTETARVTVVPAASRVTFDVTTGSGGAVDGAVIVVNDQQFGRWETTSDSQGTATLKGLGDGSYTAYVLANGYQAKAVTFQVTDGTANVPVELAAGAVGGIEITHRPISAEEAAQYGIDLSDPANQQIVRFEIHIPNQTSQVIYVPGPGSPREPFGPGCPDSSCGHVRGPGGGEIPVPRQVDPVMAWLIIPGEARFTKQFFELSAVITNTSSTEFTFTDGTATLDLPAGLSLAPTGDPQDPDVAVADIPGGGTQTVSWIIRGDTAGEFYPSVDYTATLSPVGQPIRIVGTAQTPLRVVGIESLKMTVDIDDTAAYLSPLPVTVTLTNTSDTTLDNPKLDFADQIVGGRWQPRQQLLWAQRTLAPQESLTAELVVVPAGDSTFDLKKAFVKWLSGFQGGTDEFNGRPPYVASTLTAGESAPYGKVILDWDGPPGPYRVFATTGDDNFAWRPVATGATGGHTMVDAAPGERALYAITTSESLRGQMVHNAVWATGGASSTTTVTGNDSTCSGGGTQTVTVAYADEFGLVTQWRIRDAAGVVLAGDTISDPSASGSVTIDVPAGAKDIQFANNTDWDTAGNPVWSQPESIVGCAGWNPAERRGPDTQTVSFDADPVNTLTGAESHVEADLAPYAALAGLGWGRTYDSGGVGGNPAWGFPYSDTLDEQPDGSVIYTNDRTRETTFTSDGSGGFNPAPDEPGELSTAGAGWELAYPDGSKVTFDADGLVSSKVFADGQIVTTTRGTSGRLESVQSNTQGESLTFGYDTEDRLETVTTSDGRAVTYGYDTAGYLVTATKPGGLSWTYSYDPAGRLLTILDPAGVPQIRNTLDGWGRVIRQIAPGGAVTEFRWDITTHVAEVPGAVVATEVQDTRTGDLRIHHYDAAGRLVAMTDPNGNTIERDYDGLDRINRSESRTGLETTVQRYPSGPNEGLVHIESSPAGSTEYTYDTSDRPIEIVRTGTEGTTLTTTFGYDGAERIPNSITTPDQKTTTQDVDDGLVQWVEDPDGVKIRFEYDEHRRLTKTVDDYDNETVRTYWPDSGLLKTVETPEGLVTGYTYDDTGQVTRTDLPGGAYTEVDYDDHGRPEVTRDENGQPTVTTYNPAGLVETVTDPLTHVTRFEYDADGEPARTIHPDGTASEEHHGVLRRLEWTEDELDRRTSYEYDTEGRVTKTTDPAGLETVTEYDTLGRPHKVTDPTGLETVTTYDEFSRPETVTTPDGTTTTSYDAMGRVRFVTDESGVVTETRYTDAGRVERVIADVDGVARVTRYEYDDAGRQDAVIAPGELRTETEYNNDGQVTLVRTPEGNETTTTYDPDTGRVQKVTDPAGVVRTTTYTPTGQVDTETVTGQGTVDFDYDNADQVAAVTDANQHTTLLRYDLRGRQIEREDPNGNSWATGYDDAGAITSTTDPLGRSELTEHDDFGRVDVITDASGRATDTNYDNHGRVAGWTASDNAGNTLTATTNYDPTTGRVASETLGGDTWTYDYYDNGDLKSVTSPDSASIGYTWDTLGRRDTVTGPDGFTQRYVYDNKGDVEAIRTKQYLADRFVGAHGAELDPAKWDTAGSAPPTISDGAASFTVTDTPGSSGWMKSQGTLDSGYDTTYTVDLGDRTKATKVHGYNRYVTGDSWDAIEFTSNSTTAKLKRKALWWNLTLGTIDIPATGKLRVRMNSGQQWLHVKVWADGDPEPENWDIGIQNQHPSWWGKPEWRVTGSAPNTANTVTVDDVSIARLNGAETDLVTYAYNDDHQPTTETLPMGAVRTWGYVDGRIETMTQTGAGIDSDSSIGYDTSGRIDTETVDGELTTYGYDPAGQLTTITPTSGQAESFTYTNLGQRHTQTTTAGVTTYNYNDAAELTSTTGIDNTNYTHDPAGRRLTETTGTDVTSYHYDPAGRHLGTTDPTATTLRALDPAGNPEQVVTTPTTGPVETSRLHWDTTKTNAQLVALTNPTGTTNTLVRPNPNHAWSAVTTGATTRPLATDIHHSTTADGPAATLATATAYDPFGQPAATPAHQPTLGYRSETTIETLTHLRARQYQPNTSTFTTTDPLPGVNGTSTLNNPYHYTNNNPLNLTDPTGMSPGDQPYLLAGGVLVVPAGFGLPSVGSMIVGAVSAIGATAAGTAALIVGTAAAGFAVGYYVVGPALEGPIDWVYDTFFAPDWDKIARCGDEYVAGRYTAECAAQIPNLNWERTRNNTNQPKNRPLPPPTSTRTDRCPSGAPPTIGAYGSLPTSPGCERHHIIQHAAVRDVPSYSRSRAAAIILSRPAHLAATVAQNAAPFCGTFGDERRVADLALSAAGVTPPVRAAAIAAADAYFMGELGLTTSSPVRIPGTRRC